MDFDSKVPTDLIRAYFYSIFQLLLFKKKALWKQLEGYKAIISQKEELINKCEKEKVEADRVAKVLMLVLSKVVQFI